MPKQKGGAKWYSDTEPFAPKAIKELKAVDSELDKMRKATNDAADKLVKSEIENQIEVQKMINAGTITQNQAEQAKAIATRDRIQNELFNAKQQAIALAKLAIPEDSNKALALSNKKVTNEKEITELTLKALQAQGTVQEKQKKVSKESTTDEAYSANQVSDLKSKIAAVDRLTKDGHGKLIQAESQRQIDIQRLVNAGTIDHATAENLKGNATRDRLNKELTLSQQQSAKLAALPNSDNPEAQGLLDEKRRAAKQQTTNLVLKLLQAEATATERVRLAAIKGIEDTLALKTRAYDLELSALNAQTQSRDRAFRLTQSSGQAEIAAIEIANRSLERQNNLLTARGNLQKAKSNASISETELALADVNQQIQGNRNDFALLQQKANLETQLSTQRRSALIADQASSGVRQQLEVKSNDLASKRLLIEAQLTELKAKQAVLDAQSALIQQRITDQRLIAIAQAEVDKANQLAPGQNRDRQVADAQSKVSIVQNAAVENQANAQQSAVLAQQQVGLTQQNTQAVREQIVTSTEINRLKNEALAIEQTTALKQFDALEVLRLKRVEQERITQSVKDEEAARSPNRAPTALPARFRGGSVAPGQPFIGAEEGAEAVHYRDGSYGWLPSMGVYEVPRSGMVLTARQTSALMGGSVGVSLPKGMASVNPAGSLIAEVKALRADLSRLNTTTTNQFQIVADQDPYRRMAEIAATVNRSRWR